MRVLHTISSMGMNSGGPALSTFLTVNGLRDRGVLADVLTYAVSDKSDKMISPEDFIHTLPAVHRKFAYSAEYKEFLMANRQYDLYHVQGIWQYPGYITPRIARKFGKPYLITPRGMLYPQDLAQGRLKKELFLKFFLLYDLQRAACVHATCMEEMGHIRRLGVKSPVAVIANPVDITGAEGPVENKSKLRIGYLGRVHPRKHIERLIYAWEKLESLTDNGDLVIIGDGDKDYLRFLKREVERLKLKNVLFTGFLSGAEKKSALASLSCLVVPSDFENFGMIIPEALLHGVPVIASKGTPWEELEEYHCGWWVDNDVETLTKTVAKAINISRTERYEMGVRGKKLVKEHYSVEIVAEKMRQLYEWILEKREKPDFIYI